MNYFEKGHALAFSTGDKSALSEALSFLDSTNAKYRSLFETVGLENGSAKPQGDEMQDVVNTVDGVIKKLQGYNPGEKVRGWALLEAFNVVNGKRQDAYGNPEDSFALIAAYWSAFLKRRVTPLEVSQMMMLLKIARMSGQRHHEDNFVDLAGYAAIAADVAADNRARLAAESDDGNVRKYAPDASSAPDCGAFRP